MPLSAYFYPRPSDWGLIKTSLVSCLCSSYSVEVSTTFGRIMESYLNLSVGQIIAQKYEIISLLGSGWEGEVYLTREKGTGIERTAKFLPEAQCKK